MLQLVHAARAPRVAQCRVGNHRIFSGRAYLNGKLLQCTNSRTPKM